VTASKDNAFGSTGVCPSPFYVPLTPKTRTMYHPKCLGLKQCLFLWFCATKCTKVCHWEYSYKKKFWVS